MIKTFVKTQRFDVANGTASGSVDMSQQGYTLLGVIGFNPGNSNYVINQITVGQNNLYFFCRHINNATASGEILASFLGLYIK